MKAFFTLCLFLPLSLFSQSPTQHIVGSNGDYIQGATHNVSWTVGEIAIENYLAPSNHVTEGFHQIYYPPRVDGINEETDDLSVTAYPNPTSSNLTIEIPSNTDDLDINITDALGRLVFTEKYIGNAPLTINIDDLSMGTYLVSIISPEAIIKTIKIQKN